MASRRSTAVVSPNLGLYLDRPPLLVPERGLRDCLNVRVENKALSRQNIGYGPFPETATNTINLDGKPVTLIDNFFPRAGGQFLIFANTTDLFLYDEGLGTVDYLTPRYETGTVGVTNGSPTVTGTGTSWNTELKAGDFIHIGATGQTSPTTDWYEIGSVDSATQVTLTTNYSGATASGQAYSARQTFTGSFRDYWETMVFFAGQNFPTGAGTDRWYATNGVNRPVAWDGAADQVYFPDFGDVFTCRSFAVTKNVMMLINLRMEDGDMRPFSARTSAIGEPENMVTLEASEFVVHNGADPIVTSFALGESVALYGERSITLAQFVGAPLMFVFRTVMDGIGPRAGRAVADFGDYHQFVGPDAQYVFDGIGIQESNSHIWQEVIRQSSPQRRELINSHFDEERGDLLWNIPSNSDADPENGPPEVAFVEHYLEDVDEERPGEAPHTKRQVPATAWGHFERVATLTFNQISEAWEDQNYRWNDQFFQGAFPFNLFGTINGDIFILNSRDSANGEQLTSFARFGRRPVGNLRNKSMVKRIYPFVETLQGATHSLSVRVYAANEPGGRATLAEEHQFPMTQSEAHFVSTRFMSRYIELEVRTSQAGHIWNLLGYDYEIEAGGER